MFYSCSEARAEAGINGSLLQIVQAKKFFFQAKIDSSLQQGCWNGGEELMMLGISGMCNQQGLLMDWL